MDLLERVTAELHMTALRVETAHCAWDALYDELRLTEDAQASAMVTP
jgi:hypothetical protein